MDFAETLRPMLRQEQLTEFFSDLNGSSIR